MAVAERPTDGLDKRLLLKTLTAFKKGDFSVRMPVDQTGIAGKIADTLNEVIEFNESMAAEFERVGQAAGREGKTKERASLPNARGSWKACVGSVNSLIGDLVQPMTEVSRVIGAVAKGDLTQSMPHEVEGRPIKGVFLRTATDVNTTVDQLRTFSSEVTRVAREVGTEGKLGGQAKVEGVAGTWKELTDNVNMMARNLTEQVRNVAEVTTAVAQGDLSKQITVEARGEVLALKNTINTMVDQLRSFAAEVTRVAREVGTEGTLGGQAEVEGVSGTWKDLTDNVNTLAANLTEQVRNIAAVTTAVARGDLSKQITVEAQGEILELKNTINTMVEQLGSFSNEVTRVAREVGTEGKLGGQARVEGVAGTWRELTDNVNQMANNLTEQVRNIAAVTTAVAQGDLSKQITVEAQGEILELRDTINTMVDQLGSFAAEVTRVAREVGTEGKLGGQARVEGVTGTWRELTQNVNQMASNLTEQVRNIAAVTAAVANGDLTQKVTVEARGEILELRDTINTMVGQLGAFADEVTRVAREVGTEGQLGGQAAVEGVAGTWKNLTDNVNTMASNLTEQVRSIADVTTAVANGDLSRKIEIEAQGEILELRNTINTMVEQLGSFAAEVTRVAREVGTEGQLGGQAEVEGAAGVWKDLTDNVNTMAGNLTSQVRNIAQVTTAVASGDLSKKIAVEARGEILELRNTINTMVDQLGAFADEVTRVARDVGTLGKLGGQAEVRGASGIWRELTGNVNTMAGNLTEQVRSIAEVTTAVANGDLTRKIDVEAKGEILKLRNTMNGMVDQLRSFAAEVTRVAREVGTEGELGGQAEVEGVAGTWRELTDNVNMMARNLTSQVRNIAEVTTAVANGDLSKQITVEARGEILQLKITINSMVERLSSFASEVTRVAQDVGTEGKLGGQAEVRGVAGIWKELTDNVNAMAGNLTDQVRNIAEVTTAVAGGDLSGQITVEARGEILKLKNTINAMVGRLGAFASEVTRVAQEVGTEGKLGGQASVKGVAGVWKELTDNVNMMASNLTDQVRGIAAVVTAIANGDLKRKLEVEARGEIAQLADTINSMIDTLSAFADQVTSVAREVGVEGKLGGQAEVPGASGTWRDLTDNVNGLANNLTTQVRAIADVATAVTEGDLTRSVAVEARGEVAVLTDNINRMIATLKGTTRQNEEQNWLSGNVARFTGMLQGQRDMVAVANRIMSELAPLINAQHSVFYVMDNTNEKASLKLLASYAHKERKSVANRFHLGEGLVGQCALEKKRILLTQIPEDYVKIASGLGEASPLNIAVLPVLFEEDVVAVVEVASFSRFTETQLSFLEQLAENVGIVLNSIAANARTEELLNESQAMGEELQNQQEELQQTNEELEEKAKQLEEQNTEVAAKNAEVEKARVELQDKAEQLALTSKYKSEFLANMSHELRTPLNSLLILAQMLSENREENLTPKQVEFAETIHASGADLLGLINEILDLSKIESGTMALEVTGLPFEDVAGYLERDFRQLAEEKKLEFVVEIDSTLPPAIQTDPKRLQQVLRNLCSNAFKFTEKGNVSVRIAAAGEGWSSDHEILNRATEVIAFSVSDTGIGIPPGKQKVIFEAFQQVEGSAARKYGGTGLGLAISREIASMLGGEIRLESAPGEGSTFTFYLPVEHVRVRMPRRGRAQYASQEAPVEEGVTVETTVEEAEAAAVEAQEVPDDRAEITQQDKVLLIIEDDPTFARIVLDQAREKGFKGLAATRGGTGLALARKHRPDAITLDLKLPDMTGWTVLDRIKHDPALRHIPVHIISVEDETQRGLSMGAIAYLKKPVEGKALADALARMAAFVERGVKNLLVVEDDDVQRKSIVELIGNGDVKTTAVGTAEEALKSLEGDHFDCLVLDLKLPDMSGFDLIDKIKTDLGLHGLPIIVYTGKELTQKEETRLRKAADTIIVKGVKSPERLLDETALFLHRVETKLPEAKRKMIQQVRQSDAVLEGRKVLIVDDDVRNIFAVTSILERNKMTVVYAETGKEGIELLKKTPDTDVVLMDIMMPEMDGYETTRRIRGMKKYRALPIIALTAKAMKGDRERCIEAGASDYITKPVDTEQLLSLLRVWLYR